MAWVKLDDQFADHPKVLQAGPLAGWLYICGLTYCSRLLTDGFIPSGQVRRLADLKNPDALAKRLVDAGLWESCEGGFRIHDYLEYQPTKERVLTTRAVRAEAGSLGGKRRASNQQANGKQEPSNLLAASLEDGSSTFQPRPDPTQPRCLESNAGESAHERATPSHPLADSSFRVAAPATGKRPMPADWEPSHEDRAFARQNGMSGRDIAHNAAKCKAHYLAHGERREDWSSAWRLWVLREIEGGPGAPRLPPVQFEDPPETLTEEERAAEAANRAELERQRQEHLASQPSAVERQLQKARDDPDRPDYVAPEQWMIWDNAMRRANSPQMRKRLSKRP
jgi:hypothetical protein